MKQIFEKMKAFSSKSQTKMYGITGVLPTTFLAEGNSFKSISDLIVQLFNQLYDAAVPVALPLAAVYGLVGAFNYMSMNPQKSMEGQEQMKKVFIGLALALLIKSILNMFQGQVQSII